MSDSVLALCNIMPNGTEFAIKLYFPRSIESLYCFWEILKWIYVFQGNIYQPYSDTVCTDLNTASFILFLCSPKIRYQEHSVIIILSGGSLLFS